jgi:hypothetical protein
MIMPFGCFDGLPVDCIPRGYLKWLSEKVDLRGRLKEAVFSAEAFYQALATQWINAKECRMSRPAPDRFHSPLLSPNLISIWREGVFRREGVRHGNAK